MRDTFAGLIARSYGDPEDGNFVEKDLYVPSIEHISEAWRIAEDSGHDDLARLLAEEWSRRHIGNCATAAVGGCGACSERARPRTGGGGEGVSGVLSVRGGAVSEIAWPRFTMVRDQAAGLIGTTSAPLRSRSK